MDTVLDSDLRPIVLDLHNMSTPNDTLSLVLGFAGTREDIEWQASKAAELGFKDQTSLEYDGSFFAKGTRFQKISVLPSKTAETIRNLNSPFVARAGNGIIYYQGPVVANGQNRAAKLEKRLKDEFDPKHIFPDL